MWSWDEPYAKVGWAGVNGEGVGQGRGINQRVNLEIAKIADVAEIQNKTLPLINTDDTDQERTKGKATAGGGGAT